MSNLQHWYYINKNYEEDGPVSSEEMRKMARDGDIHKGTYVWTQELPEWVPASKVAGLFDNRGSQTKTNQGTPPSGLSKKTGGFPVLGKEEAPKKSTGLSMKPLDKPKKTTHPNHSTASAPIGSAPVSPTPSQNAPTPSTSDFSLRPQQSNITPVAPQAPQGIPAPQGVPQPMQQSIPAPAGIPPMAGQPMQQSIPAPPGIPPVAGQPMQQSIPAPAGIPPIAGQPPQLQAQQPGPKPLALNTSPQPIPQQPSSGASIPPPGTAAGANSIPAPKLNIPGMEAKQPPAPTPPGVDAMTGLPTIPPAGAGAPAPTPPAPAAPSSIPAKQPRRMTLD